VARQEVFPIGSRCGSNPTYRIRSIVTTEDLETLGSRWDLGFLDEGPMEDLFWCMACAFTLKSRLRIVVLERDGSPAAIAPLERRRRNGISQLLLLGLEDLCEPMGLLAPDDRTLDRLVKHLLLLREPLFLRRVLAGSPTDRAFSRRRFPGTFIVRRPRSPCPTLPLGKGWTDPERMVNAGRRSDLRRARRRAEARGGTAVRVLAPSEDELPGLLDQAFRIEASSWKGTAGTALLLDDLRAGFFRCYARFACRQRTLRLCFLDIGGHPAAMQIALVAGGRFWVLKVGYDREYARCSPGILLLCETIRLAAREGLLSYEFLGDRAPWIDVWTQESRPCVSIGAYPHTLKGIGAAVGETIRWLGKRRRP
jgi:CelD/BcsL family acetyltransferase involved in cellulose biosynthesis